MSVTTLFYTGEGQYSKLHDNKLLIVKRSLPVTAKPLLGVFFHRKETEWTEFFSASCCFVPVFDYWQSLLYRNGFLSFIFGSKAQTYKTLNSLFFVCFFKFHMLLTFFVVNFSECCRADYECHDHSCQYGSSCRHHSCRCIGIILR